MISFCRKSFPRKNLPKSFRLLAEKEFSNIVDDFFFDDLVQKNIIGEKTKDILNKNVSEKAFLFALSKDDFLNEYKIGFKDAVSLQLWIRAQEKAEAKEEATKAIAEAKEEAKRSIKFYDGNENIFLDFTFETVEEFKFHLKIHRASGLVPTSEISPHHPIRNVPVINSLDKLVNDGYYCLVSEVRSAADKLADQLKSRMKVKAEYNGIIFLKEFFGDEVLYVGSDIELTSGPKGSDSKGTFRVIT